jgi:hypothetical protein
MDPGCIYSIDTTGSLVDPDQANLAMNLRTGFSFKGLRFHQELAVASWRSKTKIFLYKSFYLNYQFEIFLVIKTWIRIKLGRKSGSGIRIQGIRIHNTVCKEI